MRTITLTVNGNNVSVSVDPRTHLADLLRDTLHLTGTHLGCEHGVCGACTLTVDGEPVRSCITLATACDGATITTIEGHDTDEIMCALREAFSKQHALQCGYCTPGMLASARDIVLRMPHASTQDIRIAMSGNLCRCTGYMGIVRAIHSVISERKLKDMQRFADSQRVIGPVGARRGTAVSTTDTHAVEEMRPATKSLEWLHNQPPRSSAAYLSEFKPNTTLQQSFIINHPREDVWAFFADLDQVTACLPGVSVKAPSKDDHIELTMRVKVGPIAADFDGVADNTRDSSTYAGVIDGSGYDARSRSGTRGQIRYRLSEELEGKSTRVDVVVGFTITGPFAQFSRSSILQDIAKRMCAGFAQNVEASLRGARNGITGLQSTARLNAGSLIVAVMWQRVKTFLRTMLK